MKTFVLVLFFWNSNFANGPVSVDGFRTQQACKLAGDQMATEITERFKKKNRDMPVQAFCIPVKKNGDFSGE